MVTDYNGDDYCDDCINYDNVFRVGDDIYTQDVGGKYYGKIVEVLDDDLMCTFGTDEPQKVSKDTTFFSSRTN